MAQPRDEAEFLQTEELGEPDGDARGDTFPDWVLVRPDGRALTAPLLRAAPLIALGTLRIGLMMARGRGDSSGMGPLGLVAGLVLVGLPLLWVVLYITMRWANAGIRLEDGELTIRNALGRCVLRAPVATLTGVHTFARPAEGSGRPRIVVTSTAAQPRLVDPRLWDAAALRELWGTLGLPLTEHGLMNWPAVVKRFPGVNVAWRNRHQGLAVIIGLILTIAYVAVMVNLSYWV